MNFSNTLQSKKKRPPSLPTAPIQTGAVYSRQQVMAALSWGRKAWTSAVRKGLPTHKHGTQYFVTGDELIQFLSSLDQEGSPTVNDIQAH